jgi:hypothetical protein
MFIVVQFCVDRCDIIVIRLISRGNIICFHQTRPVNSVSGADQMVEARIQGLRTTGIKAVQARQHFDLMLLDGLRQGQLISTNSVNEDVVAFALGAEPEWGSIFIGCIPV